MTKLTITSKFLEMKLKKGWITADFLSHFGISQSQFWGYLNKNFTKPAIANYKRRLKANEKKATSSSTNSEVKTAITVEESTAQQLSDEPVVVSEIDSLKNEEKVLIDQSCKKEADHASIRSRRAMLKSFFKSYRDKVSQFIKEIQNLKDEFNKTYSEYTKLGSDMHSLSSSISEDKKTLEEIRAKIKSLQKISVFVYSNGQLECENADDIDTTIDSSKKDSLFAELILKEEVDCLSVRSIKQLAHLQLLVEKLKEQGYSYEITFEDSNVQKVFDII